MNEELKKLDEIQHTVDALLEIILRKDNELLKRGAIGSKIKGLQQKVRELKTINSNNLREIL
jgi:hypothetical protein